MRPAQVDGQPADAWRRACLPGSEVLLHAFGEAEMITPDETVYPYYRLLVWAAWVLDHRWSRRVLRPALDLIASSIESVDIDRFAGCPGCARSPRASPIRLEGDRVAAPARP